MDIKVVCEACGPLSANMYLLIREDKQALLIDPSDAALARAMLEESSLTAAAVLLTHGHFDHTAPIEELRRLPGNPPVFLHRLDLPLLDDPQKNASALVGCPRRLGCSSSSDCSNVLGLEITPIDADGILPIAGFSVMALHTPGHTPGSVSYLTEGCLFSGDTLFASGIGRCDLYGGDPRAMQASLQKLAALDDSLPVYPGHGSATKMAFEKRYNPYL